MSTFREVPAGRVARGAVAVPPSKSATHRALALALLGGRETRIERPLLADDTRLFLAALEPLGYAVESDGGSVRLRPVEPAAAATLFCGNAGTMLRFLVAVVTTVHGRWTLDGTPRLRERPLAPLLSALRELGADIEELGAPGHAPVRVVGGSLRGGRCRLDAAESSQYLSALLLASLRAREPVTIDLASLVSAPYVWLTVQAIETVGGRVAVEGTQWRVQPRLRARAHHQVPGDWSAACYPAVAAALTGGEVTLQGVDRRSPQGDMKLLAALQHMGAEIEWEAPNGVVVAAPRSGALRAVPAPMNLADLPDQVPTLAALAPFLRGTTRITGVPHLRLKESDRLAAMARELARLGVPVREQPDGLEIEGVWAETPPSTERVVCDTYDDHRIAMSLALVGLRRPGVVVRDPEVVSKSYPSFWDDLERLLAGVAD